MYILYIFIYIYIYIIYKSICIYHIYYGFQSLPFVRRGFVWDVLAVPDPPLLLYFFSVNNIIICSEVSFS